MITYNSFSKDDYYCVRKDDNHSVKKVELLFFGPRKKFFLGGPKCCRHRLTLGPKKTLEAYIHNKEPGGIFL